MRFLDELLARPPTRCETRGTRRQGRHDGVTTREKHMESLTKNRQSPETLRRLIARAYGPEQVPTREDFADEITEAGSTWRTASPCGTVGAWC